MTVIKINESKSKEKADGSGILSQGPGVAARGHMRRLVLTLPQFLVLYIMHYRRLVCTPMLASTETVAFKSLLIRPSSNGHFAMLPIDDATACRAATACCRWHSVNLQPPGDGMHYGVINLRHCLRLRFGPSALEGKELAVHVSCFLVSVLYWSCL